MGVEVIVGGWDSGCGGDCGWVHGWVGGWVGGWVWGWLWVGWYGWVLVGGWEWDSGGGCGWVGGIVGVVWPGWVLVGGLVGVDSGHWCGGECVYVCEDVYHTLVTSRYIATLVRLVAAASSL